MDGILRRAHGHQEWLLKDSQMSAFPTMAQESPLQPAMETFSNGTLIHRQIPSQQSISALVITSSDKLSTRLTIPVGS